MVECQAGRAVVMISRCCTVAVDALTGLAAQTTIDFSSVKREYGAGAEETSVLAPLPPQVNGLVRWWVPVSMTLAVILERVGSPGTPSYRPPSYRPPSYHLTTGSLFV